VVLHPPFSCPYKKCFLPHDDDLCFIMHAQQCVMMPRSGFLGYQELVVA
jgi:hypothetical protein